MSILTSAEKYVSDLLSSSLPIDNLYHNIKHTQRVVTYSKFLCEHENCDSQEEQIVLLAAWFHDTGFVTKNDGHEEVSAQIAENFLKENGLNNELINQVKDLILVTQSSRTPTTKLEKILKDADSGHLGSDHYFEYSELLRQETQLKSKQQISQVEWTKTNLDFFNQHHFETDTAKQFWLPKKLNNKSIMEEQLNMGLDEQHSIEKEKRKKYGRGVDTMFRIQLKNHIALSSIADTKANILLSVNAIIISVTLSNLIPKLDNESNYFLVIPTLLLTVFSVICTVLSVLSTRPNISNVTVTRDMIQNKQTNMLFFGNFYKMDLKDFEWGVDYLIENQDVLYNSLTQDLYFLGLVLNRKYRLLRITYNVFMFGIIISAIAFIVSYLTYNGN